MKFFKIFIRDSVITRLFRSYCSQSQFCSNIVRVVSTSEDDGVKLTLKIHNSRSFNIKAPRDCNISDVLSRLKLMAALQKKREEIKHEVVKKYSNSTEVAIETAEEDSSVCLMDNNKIIDESTLNIDAWSRASLLRIGDVEYEVQFNMPVVLNMTISDYVVAGCFLRPHCLLECAVVQESVFIWYRSSLPREASDNEFTWIKVGGSLNYLSTNDDVGCYLKVVCSPRRNGIIGPDFECVSKNVVEAGLKVYPFEERQKFTQPIFEKNIFRCVSYNTLANMYVEKRKFPYASQKARDIYYRKQLLLRELLGYNSDIICLQEVQERVFDLDMYPVLKEAGYNGFYTRKGGRRYEGLATFFQSSKFRVVSNEGILLNEIVKNKAIYTEFLTKVSGNYRDMSKLLAQDTALQVVVLESTESSNNKILTANTHLYSNPDNPEVRLLQAALCAYYIEYLIKMKSLDSVAVLFCGDFNSLPDSEAYNFLTLGNFCCCPSWKNNSMDSSVNEDNALQHNLCLESACGTPEYTNYTEEFQGCLDYIFYSKNLLEVTDITPFPSHETITAQVALPNEHFPSDHLALVCTLKWKDKNS